MAIGDEDFPLLCECVCCQEELILMPYSGHTDIDQAIAFTAGNGENGK